MFSQNYNKFENERLFIAKIYICFKEYKVELFTETLQGNWFAQTSTGKPIFIEGNEFNSGIYADVYI